MIVYLFDFLAVTYLFTLTLISVARFLRRRFIRTVDVIIALIFVLYAVPICLDYVEPIRHMYLPHVQASDTMRIKMAIVLITSVTLLLLGARGGDRRGLAFNTASYAGDMRLSPQNGAMILWVLSWALLATPLLAVLTLSPDPSVYLFYQTGSVRQTSAQWSVMDRYIRLIVLASLGAFAMAYWISYRRSRRMFSLLPMLAIAMVSIPAYIHAKRTFVAYAILVVTAIHLIEGRAKWSLAFLPIVLILFSVAYMQLGGKGDYGRDMSVTEVVRGDLSRDYALKIALAGTDWTSNDIFPHRLYSLRWVAVKFIPRQIFPGKPHKPPTHFTWYAKEMRGPIDHRRLGGHLQYGFIGGLLLNLGYVGLLGCFFIGRLMRWFDRRASYDRPHYILLWYLFPIATAFSLDVVAHIGFLLIIFLFVFGRVLSNPSNWRLLTPHPQPAWN